MKTIREIAGELGVSKQAVYKKIKREPLSTGLKEFTTTGENAVYIADEGVSLIRAAFEKEPFRPEPTDAVNGLSETDNRSTETGNRSTETDNRSPAIEAEPTTKLHETDNRLPIIDEIPPTKLTETANRLNAIGAEPPTRLTDIMQAQIDLLQTQVNALLEQNRDLREQLNEERKHSREKTDQLGDLAGRLAELAANSQVLLGFEQSKTKPRLPEAEPPAAHAGTRPERRPHGKIRLILEVLKKK